MSDKKPHRERLGDPYGKKHGGGLTRIVSRRVPVTYVDTSHTGSLPWTTPRVLPDPVSTRCDTTSSSISTERREGKRPFVIPRGKRSNVHSRRNTRSPPGLVQWVTTNDSRVTYLLTYLFYCFISVISIYSSKVSVNPVQIPSGFDLTFTHYLSSPICLLVFVVHHLT